MKAVRVAIFDDEEIVSAGLKVLLEGAGNLNVVGLASSSKEALNLARKVDVDLFLMDIELDGTKLVRKIKSICQNARIILLIPANSVPDFFALTSSTADGYCLKTIPLEGLTTAIEAVLNGITWIDPEITRRLIASHLHSPRAKLTEFQLSQKELDTLTLIVEGFSNQQIADMMKVNIETVKTHLRHIIKKMAVRDRTQAAVKALRCGLMR